LSKIEAGRLELERIAFDPHEVVDRTAAVLAHRAAEKGLELICDVDPRTPRRLFGDPTRLRQVLINLGGNAVKFTESGEIVVQVRPAEREGGRVGLLFSVRDTG